MTYELFAFASTRRRMHEGPLGSLIDGFTAFLRARGHPESTARYQVRLAAALSRWLGRRKLGVRDLRRWTIDAFLRDRRRRVDLRPGDRFCLLLLLNHLGQTGILTPEPPELTEKATRPIERTFAQYLREERGLTHVTLAVYLPFVRRFLDQCFGKGAFRPAQLTAGDVTGFVLRHARTWSPCRAKLMATSLRSFLRFLHLRGEIATGLAGCVPTVPDWRLSTLPKSLRPEEVEVLLKSSSDRRTPAGRRDFAILLLLARLGLRAGEIVALSLEDIDWAAGEITVHGKGGQLNRLPLPRQVGKALVAYLRHCRPRCATRRVFVRVFPPHTGFANSVAVSTLVRRAIERAGLHPPRTGAHLFRHTLASRMLQRGASLAEIGEVLRHRHPDTTAIYAKVDVERLRAVAQPWPRKTA